MSIVNIQRDGIYTMPRSLGVTAWSTPQSIQSANGRFSGSATVRYDIGWITASHSSPVTISQNDYVAIGMWMQQPIGDRVPYRVKANVMFPGDGAGQGFIIIGYQDAVPGDGTDDDIMQPIFIPFQSTFDDVITINPQGDLDTYFGRPVAFALGFATSQQVTAAYGIGHLSVQNMAVKPPTMQVSTC